MYKPHFFFSQNWNRNQGWGLSPFLRQLFAVTFGTSHFHAYLLVMCDKSTRKFVSTRMINSQLFRCFLLPSWQICRLHYQAPVLHEVFHLCGLPNIFIQVVSLNSWVESEFSPCWKHSTQSSNESYWAFEKSHRKSILSWRWCNFQWKRSYDKWNFTPFSLDECER